MAATVTPTSTRRSPRRNRSALVVPNFSTDDEPSILMHTRIESLWTSSPAQRGLILSMRHSDRPSAGGHRHESRHSVLRGRRRPPYGTADASQHGVRDDVRATLGFGFDLRQGTSASSGSATNRIASFSSHAGAAEGCMTTRDDSWAPFDDGQ